MKLLAFSVFDDKAKVFSQPFFSNTKGSAVRAFADAVNGKESDFSRHPADYTLFLVGEWDDQTGELSSTGGALETLGNGLTYKEE